MGLDAHAVPEETLAATATSLVCRFAVQANVRVLQAALQVGRAAVGAALLFGVGILFATRICSTGLRVAGTALVGTASIFSTGATGQNGVVSHTHLSVR